LKAHWVETENLGVKSSEFFVGIRCGTNFAIFGFGCTLLGKTF
jgi:hypothetical protein